MGGCSIVVLMGILLSIFAIIMLVLAGVVSALLMVCVLTGTLLLVISSRISKNSEFNVRHRGMLGASKVLGIISIVVSVGVLATGLSTFFFVEYAGELLLTTLLAFLAILVFCLVMGVLMLIIASDISKNPSFKARHRGLSILSRITGIVSVVLSSLVLLFVLLLLGAALAL